MSRRTSKVPRGFLVLLLVLAALVVVFLLANAAFTWFVERRAEDVLQSRLGSPVSVDLSGWPVAPRLLTGSLPEAHVTVRRVGLPGTRMSLGRLDVTLTDVRYEGGREGPLDPPIEARKARFESRLTENEVSGLAGALPGVKGARLTDGGLRLLLVGGVTANAKLAVQKGGLVLRPDTPILKPELPLTPKGLPGGASIDKVRVRKGEVVIEGRAEGLGV